jgi:hypothetical protein
MVFQLVKHLDSVRRMVLEMSAGNRIPHKWLRERNCHPLGLDHEVPRFASRMGKNQNPIWAVIFNLVNLLEGSQEEMTKPDSQFPKKRKKRRKKKKSSILRK